MKKIKSLHIFIFYLIALQFQFLFGTTALINSLFKSAERIIHNSKLAAWIEKKIYNINIISSETKLQEALHNFFYIKNYNNKIKEYSLKGITIFKKTEESLESKINWPHVILGALVADRALKNVNNAIDETCKNIFNKTKDLVNQPCKSEEDYPYIN
jgi:hypothetical protein